VAHDVSAKAEIEGADHYRLARPTALPEHTEEAANNTISTQELNTPKSSNGNKNGRSRKLQVRHFRVR
jgi:hypothetical protein